MQRGMRQRTPLHRHTSMLRIAFTFDFIVVLGAYLLREECLIWRTGRCFRLSALRDACQQAAHECICFATCSNALCSRPALALAQDVKVQTSVLFYVHFLGSGPKSRSQ